MARGQQKTQVNIGGTSSGAGEANAQPKKRKRGSRVVKKSVKDLFPILTSRTSPKVLVEAMASFTDEQKHDVVEMRFESLLMLRISEFPGRLIYWLTENFNPMSSELVLANGKYLHIDWKDVQRVLGFPNGPLAIDKKSSAESSQLYEEWPSLFGREHYRMTPTEVCGKMAGCEDGGSTDKIKERNSFELNNGGYGFGFVDGPYDGESSSGCNDALMDAPAEKHDNIQGSNMLDGGVQDDQDRNDAGGHAKEGNIHGNEASAAVNVGKDVGKAASKTGQNKLKKSSVVGAPVAGLCTSSHEIDPSLDLDEMQQMVAKWMFEKTGADEEELVYKVGDRSLWRREMESLRHAEYVSVDVVSVWSMILNARESLRSKSAPTRFFATAYSTMYSIVVPKYRLDDKSALAIFSTSFDAEVGVETTAKLQKIELIMRSAKRNDVTKYAIIPHRRQSAQNSRTIQIKDNTHECSYKIKDQSNGVFESSAHQTLYQSFAQTYKTQTSRLRHHQNTKGNCPISDPGTAAPRCSTRSALPGAATPLLFTLALQRLFFVLRRHPNQECKNEKKEDNDKNHTIIKIEAKNLVGEVLLLKL
ncbi:hypothetical protein DH2020_012837 [Rehmannia glutinosa]|uniref:Uncharacterized protein n=1 Tax=Rehmannia glutinosa TaxID=99300 RepID=A0ABR0X1P9_REHGL